MADPIDDIMREYMAERRTLSAGGLSDNENKYLAELRRISLQKEDYYIYLKIKGRDDPREKYDIDHLFKRKRKQLRERYGIGAANAVAKGAKDLAELLKVY